MTEEDGVATLLAAMALGLIVWLGLLAVQLTGAVEERVALETAADAAALAAVGAAATGGDPSIAAARLAALNGATLARCSCPVASDPSPTATVWVTGEVVLPLAGARTVEATASAELVPGQPRSRRRSRKRARPGAPDCSAISDALSRKRSAAG